MALTIYYGLHGLLLLATALSVGWRMRRNEGFEAVGSDLMYVFLVVGMALAALVPAATWLTPG